MPRLASEPSVEISEKSGVRYLHFGSEWIQGAMRVQRPNALELAYTREMLTGLLLRDTPWPRRALLIGLGAGSLAKFLYHKSPETKIIAVEIDPRVEIVARLHFKLPQDPDRLKVLIGDGVDYLKNCRLKFDLILIDGFDKDADPGLLDSSPFYHDCRARLTDDGLLAINLLGKKRFEKSAEMIAEAFEERSLVFQSADNGNAIALAAGGNAVDVSFEEISIAADTLYRRTGLNLASVIPRLQDSEKRIENRLLI
ncbi:MAG: fused MFS/spermidine synthase [Candidatus Accumulibacter sp.]|nr:fused MFS/spermidine synthase [Accumulibacter sp.]